jgi:hypothetical protein
MTWTACRISAAGGRPAAAAPSRPPSRHGRGYDVEYRLKRLAEGRDAWVAAKGQGTYRPDGTVQGMIGVVQDITERKHAEERQALLIRELHHRVKNTLATVQAIVGSTARTASTIDEFYQAFVAASFRSRRPTPSSPRITGRPPPCTSCSRTSSAPTTTRPSSAW